MNISSSTVTRNFVIHGCEFFTPKPSKLAGKDTIGDVFVDNPFQKFHTLTACLTKDLINMDRFMSDDIHLLSNR